METCRLLEWEHAETRLTSPLMPLMSRKFATGLDFKLKGLRLRAIYWDGFKWPKSCDFKLGHYRLLGIGLV